MAKPKPFNNPFSVVKLPPKPAPKVAPKPAPVVRGGGPRDPSLSEEELWAIATEGADQLADRSAPIRPDEKPIARELVAADPELVAYDELRELIDGALPFDVSGGEALEGAARGLDPKILK